MYLWFTNSELWPHSLSNFREDIALNFLGSHLQYDLSILDADPGACKEMLRQVVEAELTAQGRGTLSNIYSENFNIKFGRTGRRTRLPQFSLSEREETLVRQNYSDIIFDNTD